MVSGGDVSQGIVTIAENSDLFTNNSLMLIIFFIGIIGGIMLGNALFERVKL